MENLICRCCLGKDRLVSIFHAPKRSALQGVTYSDMISVVTCNEIFDSDGLPNQICRRCLSELKKAYKFKRKCDESYNKLISLKKKEAAVSLNRTQSSECKNTVSEEKLNLLRLNADRNDDKEYKDVKEIKIENDVSEEDFPYPNHLEDGIDISEGTLQVYPHEDIKSEADIGAIDVFSENLYLCFVCDEKFATAQALRAHATKHNRAGLPFRCEECKKDFQSIKRLNRHNKLHQDKKHMCEICSKTFTFKHNLTIHLRSHAKGKKTFDCPVCKKMFMTDISRNYHLSLHTDLKNLDEKTLAEVDKIKLIKSSTSTKPGGRANAKKTCNECGKVFRRRGDIIDHINRHLGIQEYYCELCKKYVPSERRHKYFHKIKNVDATCPVCSKVFTTKSTMKQHLRIHTKERPYECPDCGSTFAQRCTLRVHLLVHTKEKHFICHVCSKSFRTKYRMSIHIRTHTNERPFACDKCPKKFKTGNDLRLHRSRHDEIKMFPCELCEKAFKTKNDQRAHLKVHRKVRSHPCRLCEKVFYRSDHRSRHERTVHCLNATEQFATTLT